jgi:hypothetical protein
MSELMTVSVGLPGIGSWSGEDPGVALKHKLMLGAISVVVCALLPGCSADKQPSLEETSLATAAKDVTIPLEAGKKKNPLPETDEVVKPEPGSVSWVMRPMPRSEWARRL